MRLDKSSNPVMSDRILDRTRNTADQTGSMTINGTINKIGLLVLLVVASAAFTWRMVAAGDVAGVYKYIGIGIFGGLITSLITVFRPQSAAITAPIYAIFEGLFLGAISALINASYAGLPFQAVMLTFGTLFTMLFLYRSGRIRATPKFRRGVLMATGAVFFAYLLSWIMSLFGINLGYMHSTGSLGILISLVIIGIAALNLILDFDFIERGSQMGAPKYMEWYGAFGLIVTLVWLYLEILRLLARFAGRD